MLLDTTHNLFGNKFKVKQSLQLIGEPVLYNNNVLREHVATIANTGNHSALNMRIMVSMSNGNILKVLITHQKYSSIVDAHDKNGIREIFISDFAPNSILKIGIWTINSQNEVYTLPQLDATFYGGVVESSTIEEINNDRMGWNYNLIIVLRKLQERFVQSDVLHAFFLNAEKYGVYVGLYDLNLENEELQWLFLVISILLLLFCLFLLPVWLTAIATILVSILLWTFSDITININWVMIFIYLAFFILMFTKKYFVRIVLTLTSIPMVVIYFLSVKLSDFDCIVHASDVTEFLFCPPISVPIGLIISYSFLILYLLIIELKTIYVSEYET